MGAANISAMSLEEILEYLGVDMSLELFYSVEEGAYVAIVKVDEIDDGFFGYDPDSFLFAARQAFATWREST